MIWKWIGAMLVIAGCGAVGFSVASNHRKTEAGLRHLKEALAYMESELSYRLTPLPDLCRLAGSEMKGMIGRAFLQFAGELDSQISPNVSACVNGMLCRIELPGAVQEGFRQLGTSMGRFDLEGQLKGLELVQEYCDRELEKMSQNRDERLRSYQTLGLCAGAALAILFV